MSKTSPRLESKPKRKHLSLVRKKGSKRWREREIDSTFSKLKSLLNLKAKTMEVLNLNGDDRRISRTLVLKNTQLHLRVKAEAPKYKAQLCVKDHNQKLSW
ncbi:hypothetical protein O6H91_Y036600 [Diphasiastrum complanatum]|nr:hypothetical protein O6H91_Y036600 [Diphasiastrum complanatum]